MMPTDHISDARAAAARADLRARLMRRSGCTLEQAEALLDRIVVSSNRILDGGGFRDCAHLADVLPSWTPPGLDWNDVLLALYVDVRIFEETQAGRVILTLMDGRPAERSAPRRSR